LDLHLLSLRARHADVSRESGWRHIHGGRNGQEEEGEGEESESQENKKDGGEEVRQKVREEIREKGRQEIGEEVGEEGRQKIGQEERAEKEERSQEGRADEHACSGPRAGAELVADGRLDGRQLRRE
jgi:hypothetical protein